MKNRLNPIFWLYFIPPGVWLGIFFLAPLAVLWVYSFGRTNEQYGVDIIWTMENYIRSFEYVYIWTLFKSIILTTVTTIICVVVGFFVALFISFSSPSWKMFWLVMIILPFWTNLLIRVFGLVTILSNSGVLNKIVEFFYNNIKIIQGYFGFQLITSDFFTPIDFIYNYTAVIIGMVYVSLPFMVLPIFAALDRLDISYLEASLDLGANHVQTITKVMIPMVMPGIRTGIFLTFIPSLSTFLIPELLGGPNAEMFANIIQRQFGAGANWPFGSALAFVLMYITFFFLLVRGLFQPRAR